MAYSKLFKYIEIFRNAVLMIVFIPLKEIKGITKKDLKNTSRTVSMESKNTETNIQRRWWLHCFIPISKKRLF
jgi:hypothetical protein